MLVLLVLLGEVVALMVPILKILQLLEVAEAALLLLMLVAVVVVAAGQPETELPGQVQLGAMAETRRYKAHPKAIVQVDEELVGLAALALQTQEWLGLRQNLGVEEAVAAVQTLIPVELVAVLYMALGLEVEEAALAVIPTLAKRAGLVELGHHIPLAEEVLAVLVVRVLLVMLVLMALAEITALVMVVVAGVAL